MLVERAGFADEDGRAEAPQRLLVAGGKPLPQIRIRSGLQRRDAFEIDAVRAADPRNALRGLGPVGELGRADDARARADGEQLFGQVRGERDDAPRRLRQRDRRAAVVDDAHFRRSAGSATQKRRRAGEEQRDRAALHFAASAVPGGSVMKPILPSPACCAAAMTEAMLRVARRLVGAQMHVRPRLAICRHPAGAAQSSSGAMR